VLVNRIRLLLSRYDRLASLHVQWTVQSMMLDTGTLHADALAIASASEISMLGTTIETLLLSTAPGVST
jgi:hypothetical protein